VYPAERIDTALANYFRPGNLSALRELALAWVADRVEEGLARYRRRHEIEQPWETRERVLVALTGSRDGERLVRRAARMSQRMRGDLVAVHVIPQDGLAAPSAALLEKQRELVEEFGGTYQEVVGGDAGEALVEAARSLNATQIVMGASRRSRWQRLTRGSVIGRVIRASGAGIDVHVVSHPGLGDPEDSLVLPRTRRPAALPRRRQGLGVLLALVGLPVLTAVLAQLRDQLQLSTVLLVFLLLVVAISALGGLWPALAAAIAAFLLVNWYFTPPLYTFSIRETEHLLSLLTFLAVAGTVSGLVALAARRSAEGARARAEAEALSRLAGAAPVSTVLESLRRILGLEGAAVLHRNDGGWRIDAESGENIPETPEASASTIELDDHHVLALAGAPVRDEDRRVLDAFVRELAASVEIGELEAEAETAETLGATNELRAALLSAVSHDLRTPLSAIKASVTSILQQDVDWTPEARQEFLDTIDEETDRLNALVGNLLDMSRLQSDALQINAVPVGLEQVVPAALQSLGIDEDSLELDVPETLPRVLADPGLLERALANVIQNAIRFSPPDAPPRVTAGAVNGIVDVRIVDRGPGVHEADRERLFVAFQRLGDSGHGEGVGLGLAVARGFVEAMGGDIEVEDTPGGGLTVILRLPAAT
jgi:two-component system sensor histidine kinase KdpD